MSRAHRERLPRTHQPPHQVSQRQPRAVHRALRGRREPRRDLHPHARAAAGRTPACKLEFQLQDATPLLAGEGTVVWIREHDPTRENVTPGMGVRFDKLTPESQPTLEKILAEKTRLQSRPASRRSRNKGRRDGRAPPVGRLRQPRRQRARGPRSRRSRRPRRERRKEPPPVRVDADLRATPAPRDDPGDPQDQLPRVALRGTRGARVRRHRRGPFTRARTHHRRGRSRFRRRCSSRRPRPTSTRRSRPCRRRLDRRPPRAQRRPLPRYVADDASNEPTRVADIVDELVGGALRAARRLAPTTLTDARRPANPGRRGRELRRVPAPSATTLDEPLEIADVDVEPAVPEVQAAVAAPVAPEPSKRFRAASRAYPTLNRRRSGLTSFVVVLIVLGAAAGAGGQAAPQGSPLPAPPHRHRPRKRPPRLRPPRKRPPRPRRRPTPAAPEGAGGAAAVAALRHSAAAEEKAAARKGGTRESRARKGRHRRKAAPDEKKPLPPKTKSTPASIIPSSHKAEAGRGGRRQPRAPLPRSRPRRSRAGRKASRRAAGAGESRPRARRPRNRQPPHPRRRRRS